MTSLLDFGHELGLPLRGRQTQEASVLLADGKTRELRPVTTVYGWTTKESLAETMRGAGATVTSIQAARGRWFDKDTARFDGWQISFPLDREAHTQEDAA